MLKLNSRNQEESASLGLKLANVHNELLETKVTHNMIKEKLEGELKSATAAVDAAKLDLVRHLSVGDKTSSAAAVVQLL